ncbi:hypothetical protein [Thermococcus sp.]|uniref:hypothetical protein n=1 Tax=Thermococcus sp. TaxID=35749 RepID=UPI002605C28E|nr:hypothetical protein [Thermococcus sp.]
MPILGFLHPRPEGRGFHEGNYKLLWRLLRTSSTFLLASTFTILTSPASSMAFPFGQCIGVITGDFIIMTEEPEKKILRVKELAEKYGTVFNMMERRR